MEEYIYAVTRVHYHEQRLLSQKDIDQLISAKNADEAFRLLRDKSWGYADTPHDNADLLIASETSKTWRLIDELLGDLSPFNVFRYASDFHNLKAAIKLNYSGVDDRDYERFFLTNGTVEPDRIVKAAKEHDFSLLPPLMAESGKLGYEALAHTGNGQNCDIIIDRASLAAVGAAGKSSESDLLRRYAELTVDSANIKAAVRCALMKKSSGFTEMVVAPYGTLDTAGLVRAAMGGEEEIYGYLSKTTYSDAVTALKNSMAEFERWCDNQLIEMIRPQKSNFFGIEPLAAYILARENEIKMVRLILSVKLNNLSSAILHERLRETYV
jgi:V/A-type H+-transporting ATPase subunit C